MNILATVVVAYFFLMGRVNALLDLGADPIRHVGFGLTNAVKQQVDRPASDAPDMHASAIAALDQPLRWVTRTGRVAVLPRGCRTVTRPYDLVVHFHGAPPAMENALEASELNAALFIVNLGIGSGAYEDAFAGAGSLHHYLTAIADMLGERCGTPNRGIRRVALSAWSAGYGAIFRILDRRSEAERVDAVLLADGLHAGFEEEGGRVSVNRAQMEPFNAFAEEAVRGRKFFAITHSAIIPPGYASTTQTADFLLQERDLPRTRTTLPGPRPGMTQTSSAVAGNFTIRAFAGDDRAAHSDHLLGIGDTLFVPLREYWSRGSSN